VGKGARTCSESAPGGSEAIPPTGGAGKQLEDGAGGRGRDAGGGRREDWCLVVVVESHERVEYEFAWDHDERPAIIIANESHVVATGGPRATLGRSQSPWSPSQ